MPLVILKTNDLHSKTSNSFNILSHFLDHYLMYRTHTCGELRQTHSGQFVTLSGWVQNIRDKGGLKWIDLRDKFGLTQLVFDQSNQAEQIGRTIKTLGREYVLKVTGKVQERYAKNPKLPTGDIEVIIETLEVLSAAIPPPFLIEDETDGGEELRMRYRYLDLRRTPVRRGLELRYALTKSIRNFLDGQGFTEIETPILIKSTPEGARDFVVPSRLNRGEFYALPQSPQTFKQLLMVSGFDRYFQIVKCFRDEDLRTDRQPEFTQLDCEMSFVEREDVLKTFEALVKYLFKTHKKIDLPDFPRLTYQRALSDYGTDRPDLRFGLKIQRLDAILKGEGFKFLDESEVVIGFSAAGAGNYSRKQIDALTKWVRQPHIGAGGLVYVKYQGDNVKSSLKNLSTSKIEALAKTFETGTDNLILILAGSYAKTYKALGLLRLEMAKRLNLSDDEVFVPLWVVDFPMFERDEETGRLQAVHHPFTAPTEADRAILLESDPTRKVEDLQANAYDLVINGVEIGGGSIRIHDADLQAAVFKMLEFSAAEAEKQFGFLMNAFKYGAPPHGGIAFGLDRLCSLFGGSPTIRDFIAFPKNTSGRDTMIDTPSKINATQFEELGLKPLSN